MRGNALGILRMFDRKRRLYRGVYATPDGRAVIDDIVALCAAWKAERITGNNGQIDPYAMAMNHGAREIASHIVKHLGVSDLEMQLRLKNAQETGAENESD